MSGSTPAPAGSPPGTTIAAPRSQRAIVRRTGVGVLAIVLCVYVSSAGGSLTTTDAVVTYEVTRSLVQQGSVALPSNLLGSEAHRGIDGRYYSPFGMGQSLYNIPFYLAGAGLERALGLRLGKPESVRKAAVAMGSTLAAALCAWLTFLFAWRLTRSVRGACAAAFLLAFATALWPYATFGFNTPLATLCLLGGVYGAWTGVREARAGALVASGLWLGAALLTRHELVLALLPVGLWLACEARFARQPLLRWSALLAPGVIGAATASAAYNLLRFGNPLDAGYLRDPVVGFGSPMLTGLYGLLLSPGASIFVYSPIAVLGPVALVRLHRQDRSTAVFFETLVITFVLFYATLGNWAGGRSYGMRYLVAILPYLCLPLALWLRPGAARRGRFLMAALCTLSILVQVPGVLVDYAKVSVAYARQVGRDALPDRQLTWRAAPLVLNTRAAVEAVPRNLDYLLGRRTPPVVEPPAGPDDRDFSQQLAFSLDFWWLYLFYLGVSPRGVSVGLGVVPLLVAGLIAWRLTPGRRQGHEGREHPPPA